MYTSRTIRQIFHYYVSLLFRITVYLIYYCLIVWSHPRKQLFHFNFQRRCNLLAINQVGVILAVLQKYRILVNEWKTERLLKHITLGLIIKRIRRHFWLSNLWGKYETERPSPSLVLSLKSLKPFIFSFHWHRRLENVCHSRCLKIGINLPR